MTAPLQPGTGQGLFTDLYGLTMAQAYQAEGMEGEAVFEVFFRVLPDRRNYLVAAGLEDVLAFLENLHFTDDDLTYLAEQGTFSTAFLNRLRGFRFTGDVYAMPEGTPVFPQEPLLQVVAPIFQGQLVETFIVNQVHFQSVIAAKAARVVTAAAGRAVVEFGARRAHGLDAALKVARNVYLAGAVGTSLVAAGKLYGIPIFGTMAHSYIQAHEDEAEAFEVFAGLYPDTTLLVDTYDTLEGVHKVIALSQRLRARFRVSGIRLDSGDLAELACQARRLLDGAGLSHVRIFASGDLDEERIAKLLASGAPIDSFGVGTRLATAVDAPSVDLAYKLVEYNGRPRLKFSSHKAYYPGRKQVFRIYQGSRIMRDLVARHDEAQKGKPLLEPVMQAGKRLRGRVPLEHVRRYTIEQREQLAPEFRSLEMPQKPFSVEVSDPLERCLDSMRSSGTTSRNPSATRRRADDIA
jgi:nicotinate phosphoribosyltransferase